MGQFKDSTFTLEKSEWRNDRFAVLKRIAVAAVWEVDCREKVEAKGRKLFQYKQVPGMAWARVVAVEMEIGHLVLNRF